MNKLVSRNLGPKPNLRQETLTLWGLALRGEQETAITFECNVRPEVQYDEMRFLCVKHHKVSSWLSL